MTYRVAVPPQQRGRLNGRSTILEMGKQVLRP